MRVGDPHDDIRIPPSVAWPPAIEIVGSRGVATHVNRSAEARLELRAKDPVRAYDGELVGR